MSLQAGMRAALVRLKVARCLGKQKGGSACEVAELIPCIVLSVAGDSAQIRLGDGQKRIVRTAKLVYAQGARA